MAKILVTGGAGFIGSHVVDGCIAAGHTVAVIDDLTTGSRDNLNPEAAFHEIDIRSENISEIFAIEKPDYVLHLAAQIDVRRSVREPMFDADVNIVGSINLLECCVKHGVKKIVFASTGGAIYGEPAELPASEACPPGPICHYGASKLAVEHYIRLYQALYQLPYTILRFPNVYGPRQSPEGEAGVCSILIGLMREGKTPTLYGHGAPLRDYVYVGDIARGAVLALDKGDGTTINLGSGKGTSVQELFDALKSIVGFEGAPKLEDLRAGEIEAVYTTGDRARELLGWEPTMALHEGLVNTAAYIDGKA